MLHAIFSITIDFQSNHQVISTISSYYDRCAPTGEGCNAIPKTTYQQLAPFLLLVGNISRVGAKQLMKPSGVRGDDLNLSAPCLALVSLKTICSALVFSPGRTRTALSVDVEKWKPDMHVMAASTVSQTASRCANQPAERGRATELLHV